MRSRREVRPRRVPRRRAPAPRRAAGTPGRSCTARCPSRAGTAGRRGRGRACASRASWCRASPRSPRSRSASARATKLSTSSSAATSRAGTSAARRPCTAAHVLHRHATPGWRRSSARPAAAAARATARSALACAPAPARRSARAATARAAAAEERRRDVSRADDVAQHARHDAPTVERGAVGAGMVRSGPAAPATYANASGRMTFSASASNRLRSVETLGLRPETPSRYRSAAVAAARPSPAGSTKTRIASAGLWLT